MQLKFDAVDNVFSVPLSAGTKASDLFSTDILGLADTKAYQSHNVWR
jgi:hypothetical protein